MSGPTYGDKEINLYIVSSGKLRHGYTNRLLPGVLLAIGLLIAPGRAHGRTKLAARMIGLRARRDLAQQVAARHSDGAFALEPRGQASCRSLVATGR